MQSVLITGAGGVYAQALAQVFKEAGITTIGVSRSEKLNPDLFDYDVHADLSRDSSVEEVNRVLKAADLEVSGLVANAGNRGPSDHLVNLPTGEISSLINVHCNSAVRALHACAGVLAKPFKFIAVSSRFSSFAMHEQGEFRGYRPLYSYSIAKAALNMLCMRLRAEFSPEEAEIYLVHPGKLLTGISATDAADDPLESARRLLHYVGEYDGNRVQLYDLMKEKVIGW